MTPIKVTKKLLNGKSKAINITLSNKAPKTNAPAGTFVASVNCFIPGIFIISSFIFSSLSFTSDMFCKLQIINSIK